MGAKAKLSAAQWDAIKAELRQILIDVARAKQIITYSELAAQIQTAHIHYHSFVFARLLNEACYDEDYADRALLGAVVVTKQTGLPSGGFFKIAASLGRDVSDLEVCWQNELQNLYHHWETSS